MPLAFAGLWDAWRALDGVVWTFAILTTSANATMRQLHERMPVILGAGGWPVWLGQGSGAAAELMRPAANNVLRLRPVSRAVNSIRNNRADLLDRIHAPVTSWSMHRAGLADTHVADVVRASADGLLTVDQTGVRGNDSNGARAAGGPMKLACFNHSYTLAADTSLV